MPARMNSGPAPDPQALRREREADWLTLPAGGRLGDTPDWPLKGYSEREAVLWGHYWQKPQAAAWERFGLHYEVAVHVRTLAEAEMPMSPANLRTLVRQQMDSLGLTMPGLRANRWKLSEDETAVARHARAELPANRYSGGSRIKRAA